MHQTSVYKCQFGFEKAKTYSWEKDLASCESMAARVMLVGQTIVSFMQTSNPKQLWVDRLTEFLFTFRLEYLPNLVKTVGCRDAFRFYVDLCDFGLYLKFPKVQECLRFLATSIEALLAGSACEDKDRNGKELLDRKLIGVHKTYNSRNLPSELTGDVPADGCISYRGLVHDVASGLGGQMDR